MNLNYKEYVDANSVIKHVYGPSTKIIESFSDKNCVLLKQYGYVYSKDGLLDNIEKYEYTIKRTLSDGSVVTENLLPVKQSNEDDVTENYIFVVGINGGIEQAGAIINGATITSNEYTEAHSIVILKNDDYTYESFELTVSAKETKYIPFKYINTDNARLSQFVNNLYGEQDYILYDLTKDDFTYNGVMYYYMEQGIIGDFSGLEVELYMATDGQSITYTNESFKYEIGEENGFKSAVFYLIEDEESHTPLFGILDGVNINGQAGNYNVLELAMLAQVVAVAEEVSLKIRKTGIKQIPVQYVENVYSKDQIDEMFGATYDELLRLIGGDTDDSGSTTPAETLVLFDHNDVAQQYWWSSDGYEQVYATEDGYSTTWYKMAEWVGNEQKEWDITIDCTNYSKCTVRVNGTITSHPKGTTTPHAYIRVGFTDDYEAATTVVEAEGYGHWGDTDLGYQFIHDGCNYSGLAYNKWYDLEIDVSSLTGNQKLKVFVGGNNMNHTGHLSCSKITLSN